MLITDEQRSALVALTEVAAHGRALRHERQNPKQAPELAELVQSHKATGEEKTAAAEVVEKFRAEIAETTDLIEKQKTQIAKKTEELNDGTGLTSRDLVNLQNEIAGHEERVGELEEAELASMEGLETAESDLAEVEARLAEVIASGRRVQTAVKDRNAELASQIDENSMEADRLRAQLPDSVAAQFDANTAQGGPGAALLTGPNCQACGQQIGAAAWKTMLQGEVNETYSCEECEAVLLRKS